MYSSIWHMVPYGDVIIEHVDFSIHTYCMATDANAAQIELVSCCVVFSSVAMSTVQRSCAH